MSDQNKSILNQCVELLDQGAFAEETRKGLFYFMAAGMTDEQLLELKERMETFLREDEEEDMPSTKTTLSARDVKLFEEIIEESEPNAALKALAASCDVDDKA